MGECVCCGYLAAAGIFITVVMYLLRKHANGKMCLSKTRLDGKTVVITGANTGIGKETAVDMAKRGATVIMACRDQVRGETALQDVKYRSGSATVYLMKLDLASLASIRNFSEEFLQEYDNLHILINNAGIMMCPQMKTEDGFEMQIGVNHFGHFALTNLLLSRIKMSAPSRVVNVSSKAHDGMGANIYFDDINLEKNYNYIVAYSQSKLANILFTKELNRKLADSGVTTYSLHPGVIVTDLGRHSLLIKVFYVLLGPLLCKSVEQGAQTTIHCAVQEGLEEKSGLYFSDCDVMESSKLSHDGGMAKKLWEVSEEMTGVQFSL